MSRRRTAGIQALRSLAGVAYLVAGLVAFLLPGQHELVAELMVAPVAIAELSFGLWLLLRGVRRQRVEAVPAT